MPLLGNSNTHCGEPSHIAMPAFGTPLKAHVKRIIESNGTQMGLLEGKRSSHKGLR
jgi:hypothetical protein